MKSFQQERLTPHGLVLVRATVSVELLVGDGMDAKQLKTLKQEARELERELWVEWMKRLGRNPEPETKT